MSNNNQQEGLLVHAYVILENHLHMVVQSTNLNRDMARFKPYTAKRLLSYLTEHNVSQILEQLALFQCRGLCWGKCLNWNRQGYLVPTLERGNE
jgi:hypothetical protein